MWLRPRGTSFLHGGWWVGILVERSLLVNEPAVTCPQDQVQKPKRLNKDRKTSDYWRSVVGGNTSDLNISYLNSYIHYCVCSCCIFPFFHKMCFVMLRFARKGQCNSNITKKCSVPKKTTFTFYNACSNLSMHAVVRCTLLQSYHRNEMLSF